MNIHRRLWHWCRKPVKPISTNFSILAPVSASILIGGLLLTMLVAAVFLVQIPFPSVFRLFSYSEESGRATEVVERVLFPGGAIVVYKHPVDIPRPSWYISIKVHNYITSEEDLLAYVNSRTNALDELLHFSSLNRSVWVTVTFKEPLEPTDFKNLYQNYLIENPTLDQSAIIVENETSGELETIILGAPSPDYLEQWITYPKEGLKMINVISLEAFLKVNVVKTLKQDPRILLIDPQECFTVSGLVTKYSLMGFKVNVDRPPILVKVFEPELTWGLTTIDALLTNPSKYNRWRLYFIGKVSNLSLSEDTSFKLDEKLLVCHKYYAIDLSEQIEAENIKNGDYVAVIGTFFQEGPTLYADKIEKTEPYYPSTQVIDEILANPNRYDWQKVQVFGRVSDLRHLESFLKLDGKLLICFRYDDIDLSSQISDVQNGDPMVVMGTFHADHMTLYAETIRPSK